MHFEIKRARWTLAATLAAALLGACASRPPAPSGPPAAPDFTLTMLNGRKMTLDSLRGKVVLVDFWATWCGPCQDTIPVLETLYRRYGAQGFTIVGVNMDGGSDGVASFVKHFNMTYPVVLDLDQSVGELYRVHGIPNMFLLDRGGRVRKHWVGEDEDLGQTVETEVKVLLNEKA